MKHALMHVQGRRLEYFSVKNYLIRNCIIILSKIESEILIRSERVLDDIQTCLIVCDEFSTQLLGKKHVCRRVSFIRNEDLIENISAYLCKLDWNLNSFHLDDKMTDSVMNPEILHQICKQCLQNLIRIWNLCKLTNINSETPRSQITIETQNSLTRERRLP